MVNSPNLAMVLNPQQYSGIMYNHDMVAFDNYAPYRGRVGKVKGEYLATEALNKYNYDVVVLEFDDGKQFVFPTVMVTFLGYK